MTVAHSWSVTAITVVLCAFFVENLVTYKYLLCELSICIDMELKEIFTIKKNANEPVQEPLFG